jgi:tryptophan 2,3-dioxygenase
MTVEVYDPGKDGAKMIFSESMSYSDYLHMEQILDQQHPLTDAHDEMLFIIQHQTSELWMKLTIIELSAAREALRAGDTLMVLKMLLRISKIAEHLNDAWDVLRTMSPHDFNTFREALGSSSGLQSYQYRMIEFVLGNRNPHMLKPHEHRPEIHKMLKEEMSRTSFYDEVVHFLFCAVDGHDHNVPTPVLDSPHEANPEILARWKAVYDDTHQHRALYQLGEQLVDLEDYFRRWRFNHVTTVERIIGLKRGTGGTSGVDYLRRMLAVELFPELWHLRGEL